MSGVQDRPGFELDVVIANLELAAGPDDQALGGANEWWARWLAKGALLPSTNATLLVPRGRLADDAPIPPHIDVVYVDGQRAQDWNMTAWVETSEFAARLRALGRPARVLAQIWTNETAEMFDRLRELGVLLDEDIAPQILGSAVRYWNTKIGGHELVMGIPAIRRCVPQATMVTSLSEALARAASWSSPLILKVNAGAGGHGVVPLNPGSLPSERELKEQLVATVASLPKKAGGLGGPYLLQEAVGPPQAPSPSVDYWITSTATICIAVAEQLLDGFRYRGAAYPGHLRDHHVAACTPLGAMVGEHLRARGYRGLLNVDFVVGDDGVWIVELNVRQSAPLDQSLRMTAAHGPRWRESWRFQMHESEGILLVHPRERDE